MIYTSIDDKIKTYQEKIAKTKQEIQESQRNIAEIQKCQKFIGKNPIEKESYEKSIQEHQSRIQTLGGRIEILTAKVRELETQVTPQMSSSSFNEALPPRKEVPWSSDPKMLQTACYISGAMGTASLIVKRSPKLALPLFGLSAGANYLHSATLDKSRFSPQEREQAVAGAPQFKSYQTTYQIKDESVVLTGLTKRPSNLWLEALGLKTTLPGSDQLFALQHNQPDLYCHFKKMALEKPNEVVSFSAKGKTAQATLNGNSFEIIDDLSTVYGDAVYQMTYKEIWKMLQSQEIFLSEFFPVKLYTALKEAMNKDRIVQLPKSKDDDPMSLSKLKDSEEYPTVSSLLKNVEKDPLAYGLDETSVKTFFDPSIDQLASLVVKREDFRVFVDENIRILPRSPNQNDAIRLINACGIQESYWIPFPQAKTLIQSMFDTSLRAAEKGILIAPAIGMGVWSGDPELYWTAFLDAVIESDIPLEAIYVNPRHQESPVGIYEGAAGEEFQQILQSYLDKHKHHPNALAKLSKIKNLYHSKQDVIQLARHLKLADPNTIVSVINASDPDVTLGFHVGEYTNDLPHTSTTEENYTAMGTNGLFFEGVTNVHDPKSNRINSKGFWAKPFPFPPNRKPS